MNEQQKSYLRSVLANTDERSNVLTAWLGQNAFAEGEWPNRDRDAFVEALVAQGEHEGRLVDDRANPLSGDHPEHHRSAAAYVAALVIE